MQNTRSKFQLKLASFRAYLDYLEKHYNNVQEAWKVIQEKCSDMSFISDDFKFHTLDAMIKAHDLSKFNLIEFDAYRRHFYPISELEYAQSEEAYNLALEIHKKENEHHWQNWSLKETTEGYYHPYEAELHLIHMLCDWIGMGYKYYYEKNKDEIKLPDWAIKLMHEIFNRVYGENND